MTTEEINKEITWNIERRARTQSNIAYQNKLLQDYSDEIRKLENLKNKINPEDIKAGFALEEAGGKVIVITANSKYDGKTFYLGGFQNNPLQLWAWNKGENKWAGTIDELCEYLNSLINLGWKKADFKVATISTDIISIPK